MRSWFSRVWAIQEYILSKDAVFVCGRKEVNSSILFSEVLQLQQLYHRRPHIIGFKYSIATKPWDFPTMAYLWNFKNLRDNLRDSSPSILIGELMIHARMQIAIDPKDAVFGMFGILRKTNLDIGLPSYSDSVVESYTTISRIAINQANSLAILLEAGQNRDFPDLPSWCHNFNAILTPSIKPLGTRIINMLLQRVDTTLVS